MKGSGRPKFMNRGGFARGNIQFNNFKNYQPNNNNKKELLERMFKRQEQKHPIIENKIDSDILENNGFAEGNS